MNELHGLLKRQLRRHSSDTKPFLEDHSELLQMISDAYLQFDADRGMLEHSLELTSQELLERNAELSRVNAELEMRVAARTAELSNSEARFRELFEHAPVSIWEEDFSTVRQYIDDLRRAGIMDLSAHFDAHPEAIAECAAQVKIVDVNQATLEMYQAESKAQLLTDLSRVLGPDSLSMFELELLALAEGKSPFEQETVNYTLGGEKLIVFLRMTIAPGYAESWAKVFVGISDITERRQAQVALAAERDLLQALMDNIPDLIYFKDTSSRFTRINRAEARLLGVATPEDAIGKTDLDFQNPDLAQSFYEEEQRLVQTSKSVINRIEFNPTPDGQPRWFSTTKVPIKDEAGEVTSIVGVSHDITMLRQAEVALAAERDLLQALMDNIPDTIYFKDTSSRFTRINRAQARVLGIAAPEDAIGKTDLDFQNPDLAQSFYEEEQRIVKSGEPLTNRIEFNPTQDGQPRWFSATKVPIKDTDGSVIGIVGISRNVTERKQFEDALRDAEIKYRTLVENLPAIVYLDQYDPTIPTRYRPVYMSPQVEIMLGYHPNEFMENPELWPSLLHSDDRQQTLDAEGWHYDAGEPLHQEYRVIGRDGRVVWLRDEAVMIKDEASGKAYSQGVLLDITARKMAEEALRQSEERFRLVSWATQDAVWDWNLSTNQIQWGAGLQKIFRYPSNMLQTDAEWWRAHIHPQDRAKVDRTLKQALEGGLEFWSKEYRFQRVDGEYADIMDRAYILRDETGKPYRMIGVMMDITERKQAEATILHQNEMLSSLHQITLDLLRYRDINPLLDALVELAAKFMDASYAEIMLGEDETLVIRAATQNQRHLVGERAGRGDALLSWQAFDTREPAVLSDYGNWPYRRAVYDGFQLHAVADFPILNDDQCLGVMALGRDKPGYEFTFDQIQYGRLFANLTALVLNNAQLREALREQSIRDPLTGLYNRRYMEEVLKQHLRRVTRHLHPLGVIMIDIDHFKSFNDAHGHAAGDALLRELGRFLQSHIRGEDVACRYGGEEFILIMPDASLETARQRAEHLRQMVKEVHVHDAGRSLEGITLSLGVAVYPQHGRSRDDVLRSADAALYRAKQEGRDRVVVAEKAN